MEWISVKDRLPKIDYENMKSFARILVTDGENIYDGRYRHIFENNRTQVTGIFHTFCSKCIDGIALKNITHWMPIPQPPNTLANP